MTLTHLLGIIQDHYEDGGMLLTVRTLQSIIKKEGLRAPRGIMMDMLAVLEAKGWIVTASDTIELT